MSGNQGVVGIVKIFALVVALYFAVTEGLPWVRAQLGGGGSDSNGGGERVEATGGGDTAHCVALAGDASQALGGELRRFRTPPYDLAAWDSAVAAIDERVGRAEAACTCPQDSCQRATAAIGEIRDLVASVDGMIRGEPSAFRNLGRDQDRIDELIDDARQLARAGN